MIKVCVSTYNAGRLVLLVTIQIDTLITIIVTIIVSPYFKQKLLTLYTNALAESKNELGLVI